MLHPVSGLPLRLSPVLARVLSPALFPALFPAFLPAPSRLTQAGCPTQIEAVSAWLPDMAAGTALEAIHIPGGAAAFAGAEGKQLAGELTTTAKGRGKVARTHSRGNKRACRVI